MTEETDTLQSNVTKRKLQADDEESIVKNRRLDFKLPEPPGIIDLQLYDVSSGNEWSHEELFWTPASELPGVEKLLFETDPSNIDIPIETQKLYDSVESLYKVEWSLDDQNSRFVTSFKSPMVNHKHNAYGVQNKKYVYAPFEEIYLQRNCDTWLKLIDDLKIQNPSDIEFIMRPDFPDVISQIIGTAMRGKAPEINTEYEFRVRLPPSVIEKKILEVKNSTPEARADRKNRSSTLPGYDEKIYDTIVNLYDNYVPIEDVRDGEFNYLVYEIGKPGEKNYKKLKLPYISYRTRENIIKKHVLRQFKSSKILYNHFLKNIKDYDDTIMYVRTLPDDLAFFDQFHSLIEVRDRYKNVSDFDLFIAYRKDYLGFKTYKRLIAENKFTIVGTYSAEIRSTYHRYSNMFENYDLSDRKVCVITTDKTINDVAFRFLVRSRIKSLHVYGDFNYARLGENFELYKPVGGISSGNKIKIENYPTKDINIRTQFDQYDIIIIDTVALAVLRNSIVYGDFQEAHTYANIVMQRLHDTKAKTELFLRAGMANILFSAEPLKLDLMEIRDIKFFKATGPESIIRFVNAPFDLKDNLVKVRKAILIKKLVQEDLHKLKNSSIRYQVRTQFGYYAHDFVLDDIDIALRMHQKQGKYLSYSKTRNTRRYIQGIGADLIQTFLNDEKLKTALSHAAFKRKIDDRNHIVKDAIKNPTSMLLTTGTRSSDILTALILNNYDLRDTYAQLNLKNEYTLAEIEATFRRCLNVPIGDNYNMDPNTKLLLEAIRYVIAYEPSIEKFKKKYQRIIDEPDNFNYQTYFTEIDDKIRFNGLTGISDADVYDPMIIHANSVYAYQISDGFTRTSDVFSSLDSNVLSAEEFLYQPHSPGYVVNNDDSSQE